MLVLVCWCCILVHLDYRQHHSFVHSLTHVHVNILQGPDVVDKRGLTERDRQRETTSIDNGEQRQTATTEFIKSTCIHLHPSLDQPSNQLSSRQKQKQRKIANEASPNACPGIQYNTNAVASTPSISASFSFSFSSQAALTQAQTKPHAQLPHLRAHPSISAQTATSTAKCHRPLLLTRTPTPTTPAATAAAPASASPTAAPAPTRIATTQTTRAFSS
mmetsp:Transcript_19731/g.55765  ORF Transcript_19731/g.55765 Transcript_19731/m.55765 type:complete len:218 (+) Transcript_19731:67-720(+)